MHPLIAPLIGIIPELLDRNTSSKEVLKENMTTGSTAASLVTAAMTGLFNCSMEVKRLRIVKMNSLTCTGLRVARSFRSAPAQNAF